MGLVRRKTRSFSSGQALIEYVLLVALLSGLSLAFVRFFTSDLFRPGLNRLPAKVNLCVSHSREAGTNGCR
jgi:hypothetical protein